MPERQRGEGIIWHRLQLRGKKVENRREGKNAETVDM